MLTSLRNILGPLEVGQRIVVEGVASPALRNPLAADNPAEDIPVEDTPAADNLAGGDKL